MKEFRIEGCHAGKRLDRFMEEMEHWPHGMVVKAIRTVSYTHLTLPTIYSV